MEFEFITVLIILSMIFVLHANYILKEYIEKRLENQREYFENRINSLTELSEELDSHFAAQLDELNEKIDTPS